MFCEIAGRDEYEVDIDLRQQDLGVVFDAMRRTPNLPVDFILHAHTGLRLHTTVHGPGAISQTAHVKPGGSFFTVKADFPVDGRPGRAASSPATPARRRSTSVASRSPG